jgi:type IV secretion system protein TrbI
VSEEKESPEASPPQVGSQPSPAPALRDRRVLPEGVVPKQAQGYVVAGLAVIILLAVMFSKNHTKTLTGAPPNAVPFSNDANARKIAELEQNLSEEQRQSQQQLQTQKMADAERKAGVLAGDTAPPVAQGAPTPEPPRDPVADAERTLAFKSRFASNLVSLNAAAFHSSEAVSEPPGISTRAQDTGMSSAFPAPSPASPFSDASGEQKRAPEVNVNAAHGQPYVLFEGTTLDTVLANRLNGDFSGPVRVMLTNPVYSHDNQHLLIPEGTFLLGDAQKVAGFGQQRLAVTFHRMLMPDGYSVDLNKFHGLNQIGETGLNDQVNHHYVEIFGTSIALGVIAGAAEATSNEGYYENGSEAIRQGMAQSLSVSAAHVLDRFINVLPTITIREGHRVKVYLTQDLLLPAYGNHSIPGDI